MAKSELIKFLFGEEAEKIKEDFPIYMWNCNKRQSNRGKFHYPTHAKDTRDGSIINLIEYGRKICLIN